MDSGSYDLYQSQKQKNQLEIIKQALLKENAEVQQLRFVKISTFFQKVSEVSGISSVKCFKTRNIELEDFPSFFFLFSLTKWPFL